MGDKGVSRREVLKFGVASGLFTALGGCAITPQLSDCGEKTEIDLYVDIHNHIFNGEDVDVYELAYHNIVRLFPEPSKLTGGWLRAADKVAKILDSIARSQAYDANKEIKLFENNSFKEELRFLFDGLSPFAPKELVPKYEGMKALKIEERHVADKTKYQKGFLDQVMIELDAEIIKEDQKGLEELPIATVKGYWEALKAIRNAIQKFHWFSNLTGYRYMNALTICKSYPDTAVPLTETKKA